MILFSTTDISEVNPAAFSALPAAYQADSCLIFWSADNILFCRPKDDDVFALGSWTCFYNKELDRWEEWAVPSVTKPFPKK